MSIGRVRGHGRGVRRCEAVLALLNWSAPTNLHNDVMNAQTGFVANLVLGSGQAIGAAVLPIFSYKAGHVWLLESNAVKSLAKAGLNVDLSWTLIFDHKARLSKPLSIRSLIVHRLT